MPVKANPLKLNKLQARTLLLAQVLANDPASGFKNEDTGEVTLMRLPHAHGNHVHVGPYVVSSKDASGFGNLSVWKALERKNLARIHGEGSYTITVAGLDYETGLRHLLEESDH